MFAKLIPAVTVLAALVGGTTWGAKAPPAQDCCAAQASCCFEGSDCCYPGSPCCDDDCCAAAKTQVKAADCCAGGECCDPPQDCCFAHAKASK